MYRSNSTISSSSRIEPPDIINEEDFSVEETDPSVNWNQWTIPRIQPSSIYQTSWFKSNLSFNSEFKVKTVEQTCEVSNVQEKYYLFTKKSIQEFLSKGYKFLHIGSVQIAVKPLTRLGINASILLCLRDARHNQFETSILGMIQSSLFNGPVYFDCFLDLPLALNDPNILKALTLNIVTSDGTVKISFDPTPATSFRRNSFARSKSSFNPAAEDCERRDQNLNIFLKDFAKAAQPILNNSDLKMKGLSTSSQITSAFYSAKDVETSKGKSIKEEANKDDEDTSTLSPTASDMAASIVPLPSQLNVINRNYFEIDLISLFKDYNSKENRDKRKTYHATFSKLEKSRVKRKWKEKMNTEQKHILFFDFLENDYVSKNSLNVLKIDFVKEEGRTTVKSSHPLSEAIVISHLAPNTESNNQEINTGLSETNIIIQQNNFSNTYLQTIGQQLDRIEEKIENPISIQSSTPVSQSTNKPLIILPEKRPIFDPITKQTKTLDQINQMLKNIKIEKPSSSKPEKPSTSALTNKEEEDGFVQTTDADSSESDSSTVRNIDLLEKNFHQDDFKLAGLESKPNPMSFTRNWYSKPTPPDLQFEEKIFQSQSSYSADKTYEWNIDGMSEQEILNTMSKMSLVANAYINNNIRELDIVVILTTGFTGMIRNWWDKHIFLETREAIQHAVKKDDNGLPVFDPSINSTPFDGVNTLIYTIIKHFIGTPSNITNRVSDYLNNLRCHQMSDYRWYQDVFTSRVMLRDDSQKSYWKEKFIDGLPHLFALKVKDELTDTSGFLNYDNFTYGDIFSLIKKLGISMCNDQRMLRQQLKNSKKAKYEMGTFCEQYGLPPIAPFRRKPKQFKQFSKPRDGYRRKPRDGFYKKSPNKKSFPKKKNFQNASKGKCSNCGKNSYILKFITEEDWGTHPSTSKKLRDSEIAYNYYDYIDTWFRFMLFQTPDMSHSWFFNFDKNFRGKIPLWFNKWWHQFGLIPDIFPEELQRAYKSFIQAISPKLDAYETKFPYCIHFSKRFKPPWILKWSYEKNGDILHRFAFVKWWDRFPHMANMINTISKEFGQTTLNLKNSEDFPAIDRSAPEYPLIQAPTSSTTSKKKATISSSQKSIQSSKSKKKNISTGLTKKDLIHLLQQSLKEDSSDPESEAFFEASYSNTFGHDSEDTPRLSDD
ncbi:hypothetical protein I3843_11G046100 [Carya illinoinensis]|nr:hypothetical protein I3843_11G046100 [Carya illinoinensis]